MELRITRQRLWRLGSLAVIIAQAAIGFAATALPTDVTAATISASFSHTCAVSEGGGVKCWGNNDYAGLGNGTFVSSASPVNVAGLGTRISEVAAGNFFTCALTSGGDVKCWGYNATGQLGVSGSGSLSTVPIDIVGLGSGVRAIATGAVHACALTAAGGVRCWGGNEHGELGDGSGANSLMPVGVTGLSTGVTAIQVGYSHSCALMTGGAVKCWGRNNLGQLGDGTYTTRTTPVDVESLSSGISAIAVGIAHTCAIAEEGHVKCWGGNSAGVFGDGTFVSSPTPVNATTLLASATAIAAGGSHTCARTVDGAVSCWGSNDYGMLGDGTTTHRPTAGEVVGLDSAVEVLVAGDDHTCASLNTGKLKCWGNGDWGKLGNGVPVRRLAAVQVSGIDYESVAISTALHHSCTLSSTGLVKCWGLNNNGELGDGTTQPHASPAPVGSLVAGIKSVSTASVFTCAVTTGGKAWCWGSNASGQLGDGTFNQHSLPVAVSNLGNNVKTLALGNVHGCALTFAGGVQCWGGNEDGQLGDGTTDGHQVPGQVDGLTVGTSAIAAGRNHSCALSAAGAMKCWGKNTNGELGDGTTTTRLAPVAVVGLDSGVTAIAAGEDRTCALLGSGVVKCWGHGQLTPVGIAGLGTFTTAIAVGHWHTCALATGTVKCWGLNGYGQLGDGTDVDRELPVIVVGLDGNAASISAGEASTCAVTDFGNAWCWGNNSEGQLGNGETGFSLVPQTVVGTPFGIFKNGFD